MTQFMRKALENVEHNKDVVVLHLKSGTAIEGTIVELMENGKKITPPDTVVICVRDQNRVNHYCYVDTDEIAALRN